MQQQQQREPQPTGQFNPACTGLFNFYSVCNSIPTGITILCALRNCGQLFQ